MRVVLALLLAVVVVASGCTDGGNPASSGAPEAPAAPATVTSDTGGIEAKIFNEELVPLSGARVSITPGDLIRTTDAEGRTTFSELAPDKYTLIVEKIGYETVGKKVDVEAGRVTSINVTMVGFFIAEPYVEGPFIFNGYNQAGNAFLDIFTNGQVAGCQKCQLFFTVNESAMTVVLELSIKPTIPNPGPQGDMYFQLYPLDAGGKRGPIVGNADWSNRQAFFWDEETALPLGGPLPKATTKFDMNNYCPSLWVCVDQKFEVHYTFFHGEPAPEGFTALPPP